MQAIDPAARRVISGFDALGWRARLHVRGRWRTCPFAALEALVPSHGRILDLGCGHGHFSMYLAEMSAHRSVLGVDIDRGKVEIGRQVSNSLGLSDRVELRCVESSWRPEPGAFDGVVANDVLYLLGEALVDDVIERVVDGLKRGGRIVIKEMGDTPRWKYAVNLVQEHLAARLGVTAGSTIEVLSAARIVEPLQRRGMRVETRRMDQGFPHPHLAVVADS